MSYEHGEQLNPFERAELLEEQLSDYLREGRFDSAAAYQLLGGADRYVLHVNGESIPFTSHDLDFGGGDPSGSERIVRVFERRPQDVTGSAIELTLDEEGEPNFYIFPFIAKTAVPAVVKVAA